MSNKLLFKCSLEVNLLIYNNCFLLLVAHNFSKMSLKPKPINFTEKWRSLQETVKGVITLDRVPRDAWNERFNDVYSMCVAFPEPLGDQLYDSTKLFLQNHVLELLTIIQNGGTSNLLQNYYTYWQKYSKGVKYLHSLYQ